jgi:ParB-like nuclease domain
VSGQLQLIPRQPPTIEYTTLCLEQLTGWEHAQPRAALTEQIRLEQALLEPILVFATRAAKYAIVEGRRRTKAVAILVERGEWLTPVRIPAMIITGPDTTRRAVRAAATLTAHGTRSASPASELAAIEAIIAEAGEQDEAVTAREIARQTGMSQQTVRQRLRLRELHPQLRAAFDEGVLGAAIAEAAVKLSERQQEELVRRLGAGERLTARSVRELARERTCAAAEALPDSLFAESETAWPVTVAGYLRAALAAVPANAQSDRLRGRITGALEELEKP